LPPSSRQHLHLEPSIGFSLLLCGELRAQVADLHREFEASDYEAV
jgi:hypothetical protein